MKVLNIISSRLAVIASTAIFAFSTANAQEKLSAETFTIAPGEEAEVTVNYESTEERSGCQITVKLPEGLEFVKNYDEDGLEYAFQMGSSTLSSHIKEESYLKEDSVKITIFHMKKLSLKDGVLFTFKVKATEDLAETSEIAFPYAMFNGGKVLDPFTCTVTKEIETGIDKVTSDSNEGISYNLAGQRVTKPVKGIVIKNGKKVVLK